MANLSNINNKFIVTDGGNVLIGNTANSSGRLQIKDTQTSNFNDGLAITRNNAAQTGYINMVGGAFNFNSPGLSYKFRNNGTQTLELNSSGNATFAGTLQSGNFAIGVAPSSFGTGVPTITLRGTAANGRGGAIMFQEQDGTVTTNIYSTDGADGYGTVINAAQSNFKVSVGALAATQLTISSTTATFAGNVNAPSVLANGFMEIRSDTASLYFENAANNNYYRLKRSSNDFVIDYYNGSTTSDRLTINSSGNVGIGTTSIPNPYSGAYSNVLQVGTTSGNTRIALTSGTTKSCDLTFADSNTATDAGSTAGAISYKHATDSMLFSTANAEKMRINSQGQMWLGGSYTGSDIANGNTSYMNNLNAGSFSILHRNSSDVYVHFNSYYTSSNTYISKYSGRGFMLGYNAAVDTGFFFSKAPQTTAGQNQTFFQVMTVGYGTSNNVGIGTTSPQQKLTLGSVSAGGIQFNYDSTNNYRHQILNYWNTNTDSRMDFNIARTSGQTPETIMSVGYGGNVGIGTTSPDFALDIEVVDSGVQLQLGRTNTNVGSAWMGASGSGFAVGVGAYGAGNSVTDPKGFLIDASGNLSTRRRIQAKTDTGVGVSVTRNLFVAHGGSGFDYTFDPVALFGANKSGGKLLLEVTGWPERLNCGYIVWRNDGGGSSLIGTGQVSYVQTAVQSAGNVAVSLPSTGTNEIKITFTGWHTNDHGWSCYIKNDF